MVSSRLAWSLASVSDSLRMRSSPVDWKSIPGASGVIQLPGLKMAMPEAQYMALPKVPVKLWAPVAGKTL